MDDDQLGEEEGDNEVEAQAASLSGLGETSSILGRLPSKGEDAIREMQRQRNLEQALFIQMEMQKKLHEQLEVIHTQSVHIYAACAPVHPYTHDTFVAAMFLNAPALLTSTARAIHRQGSCCSAALRNVCRYHSAHLAAQVDSSSIPQ